MTKKLEPSFMDEFTNISIHDSELEHLSKPIQKFIEENARVQIYPKGLKRGKPYNKVLEVKRLIKEMVEVRAKNKGRESNTECMIVSSICEILDKMMLQEFRKLSLEKLL